MGLKENNGRGARRKMARRVVVIVTVSLLSVVIFLAIGPSNSSSNHHSSKRRQQLSQHLRSLANRAAEVVPMYRTKKDKSGERSSDSDSDQHVLNDIVQGKLHLIDIRTDVSALSTSHNSEYSGVYGSFCRLNWSIHKKDPSATPMFRDLVGKSPDCEHPRTVSLSQVARAVQDYDKQHHNAPDASHSIPKQLNLTAVVFHESRCGSTLVANMCVSADPSKHRVYSESAPPITALKGMCGDHFEHCSQDTVVAVLQDVIHIMSRTDDPEEERVFFKIQSIGTHSLSLFQRAFPNTPWLFVYREPVQVMMSQLAGGVKYANCVRTQRSPPSAVEQVARQHGLLTRSMSPEDYCAAHLASITETAVVALQEAESQGMAVNYKDLPDAFYQEILPSWLGRDLDEAEVSRIEQTSGQYSKGRGQKAGEFKDDSQKKERTATNEVRLAAETFLLPSYQALERSAEERKRILKG